MPDDRQRVRVGRRTVALSSLDKVLYPEDGIVKAEVIQFATRVAPYMLPHVSRRPLALVRYPEGIGGESFYQKNRPAGIPDWVPSERVPGQDIDYVTADEPATLVWLANMSALELHQIHARAPDVDTPDYLVVDLDPPEGGDFRDVVDLAFRLREHLEDLGYSPLAKTTGGKGVHVVCPIIPDGNTEEVLAAAKDLAGTFRDRYPDELTLQLTKAKRGGRVFLDILRHNPGQTVICPYSLRGRPGAPASMPLDWEDLHDVDDPREFNLRTVPDILDEQGDAWEDFDDHQRPLHTRRPAGRKKAAPAGKTKAPAGKTKAAADEEPPAALRAYADKRRFDATPEPAARLADEEGNRYTVQRHHASSLHYDLRLEQDGVLKSWAVPKGLPPRPGISRLAIQTEDHPLEYLTFEGTIPKGEYGGGEMWVFDTGTYERLKETKQRLDVRLDGGFGGEYRLIRTKGEGWLIQRIDEPEPDWLREPIDPMAPLHLDEVPAGGDLLYEVKWDGIRALVYVDEGEVRLVTRNGHDVTAQFPELSAPDALRVTSAILDGEIVCLDDAGRPSFERVLKRMQKSASRAKAAAKSSPAVCYLFDALYLDGRPIMEEPLTRRREWVEDAVKQRTAFRFSRSVDDGAAFFEAARRQGLEGVVGKEPASGYEIGRRSGAWVKVKVRREATCAVIGFTKGSGRLAGTLGSLQVAEIVDDVLEYRGKVGTGLSDRQRGELAEELQQHARKGYPLAGPAPKDARGTTWVQPTIVCEVAYAEVTEAGRFRKPSILKLRRDLEPPPASD